MNRWGRGRASRASRDSAPTSAWGASVGALGSVNFRRYFMGQLLSTLGTWMQVTALQFLPMLFIGPYAGVIADKFNNRYLLLVTNTCAGLFAAGLGVLASSGRLSV